MLIDILYNWIMMNDAINTRIANIRHDDQIITITLFENMEINLKDIRELNEAIINLSEGKPFYKLVDARTKWNISFDAKKEALADHHATTKARAVILTKEMDVDLTSFLNEFEVIDCPHKYFLSYRKAHEWLLSLRIE